MQEEGKPIIAPEPISRLIKMLLYLLIVAAFVSEFRDVVERLGPIGKLIKLVPDGLSGLLLVVVLLQLGQRKMLYIQPKYIVIGLVLILHIVLGCFVNSVPPDTIVAGFRNYFKFIPLFLLPLVVPFGDRDIRGLLLLILALMLLQTPISILQRLLISSQSGDVVRGTMSSGAIMSIALISTIGVLFAFHLRGRLGRTWLAILIGILFVPTMINETKGTVVLLPLAVLTAAIFHDDPGRRLKRVLGIIGACVLMLAIFSSVFSIMYPRQGGNIIEFYLSGDAAANVYKQKEIGEGKSVGRIDSILHAYDELEDDPLKLVFGLGIGNVSDSIIPGEFADDYQDFGVHVTTITALLWEVGILGIILSLVLLGFIFMDAIRLRADPSIAGTFGLGWVAVCALIPAAMIYKDLVHQNVVGYVFLLLAGLVASRRVWLDEAIRARSALGRSAYGKGREFTPIRAIHQSTR